MKGKYLQVLLTVILPLIIILGVTLQVSTDSSFFNSQINNLEIINPGFVTIGTAKEISLEVTDYLKGDGKIDEELLGKRAAEHMRDVKNLRDVAIYILLILSSLFVIGIIILILLKKQEKLITISFWSGLIIIIFNLLVFIFSKNSFNIIWDKLHHVLFKNDLWILNPSTDPLVATFTLKFFINFIERIVLISSIIAVILLIIGTINKLITKKHAKIHPLEIDNPKKFQW